MHAYTEKEINIMRMSTYQQIQKIIFGLVHFRFI